MTSSSPLRNIKWLEGGVGYIRQTSCSPNHLPCGWAGELWQWRSGTLANRRSQPCARGEVDLLQSQDIGKVAKGGFFRTLD